MRNRGSLNRAQWTTLLFAAFVVLPCGAATPEDPELTRVLVEFDRVQESIQTLRADFDETTTSPLLAEPMTAEGRFYMTKPDAIRWEYSSPEPMRFVIAEDQYTGYYPEQKRAERRNIHRFSDQLFRFFGLGQASSELKKFYRIRLGEVDGTNEDGAVLLVLEPRKRRARKRVETVHFWLDPETYLPTRVEYRGKDGAGRDIHFRSIQLNPDLAAATYDVDLPEDVTVTRGFGGLPHFDSGESQ